MAIGWIFKAQPGRPRRVPDRSLTLWGFPIFSVRSLSPHLSHALSTGQLGPQVVCYGTVTDILYQEEMIYVKMKDATGECVLRIIRTHYNVEPQMESGALSGIS